MGIAISEDHLALEETARRFVTSRCPPSVPRAVLETAKEEMPPFWSELAALGWLGLHVAEAHGGQGFGLVELAVVVEELGRAVAPGPFVPSVLAAGLLADAPDLLPGVVDGRSVATVAFAGAPLALVDGKVTGSTDAVLCGAVADLVVVAVDCAGTERWCVLERPAFVADEVGSLDPTRRLATVTVAPTVVAEDRWLPSVTRERVEELATILFAAECAGGAGWCLDTAAEYAKVRQQFGRPIGQFQAVKHRCADMLVAVEQARGAAWDAAVATGVAPDEAGLAAAVAAALAPEVFVRAAKDCIQVLGGIGFTWEHDAHLYLRRAAAVRQLLGGGAKWRRRVAASALAGARRRLRVELPPDAERVRAEVRAFADSVAGLPADEQRARVVDGGYFVPHWSPPWGRDAGAVEQLVIDEEFRRAKIRRPNLAVGAWAAPTIASHGSVEQQERWVRPTLLGTITWCQLFSEPGAGSDLASLTTTATRADGGWLLNGQKVWTSMARDADWGICLARTNRSAPKHLGITYLIVDMKSPGIEIRPLRELTGFAMFNEVFFTDVFVPDDCVVGEVDGGWPLARTTLANERVAMSSGSSFGGGVEALLDAVSTLRRQGRFDDDPVTLDAIGAVVADAQSVAVLGLRTTYRSVSGARPGPEASVRKLLGVEHDQRTQELGLSLLGPDGATTVGDAGQWTFGFLANRCLTIAGGTSEVQRNVIAERILGLPRDP
jgi:alkylation response protein AidB-like acyl-CoA dehydrogenase